MTSHTTRGMLITLDVPATMPSMGVPGNPVSVTVGVFSGISKISELLNCTLGYNTGSTCPKEIRLLFSVRPV